MPQKSQADEKLSNNNLNETVSQSFLTSKLRTKENRQRYRKINRPRLFSLLKYHRCSMEQEYETLEPFRTETKTV